MPEALNDEAQYRLLRVLEDQPEASQRELARELGMSLGKTNYCLKALIGKGWVKAKNFKNSSHKLGYAYRLTPSGLKERARATARLLERKSAEFDALRKEIARLKSEIAALDSADG